jgi:hypothetical protein
LPCLVRDDSNAAPPLKANEICVAAVGPALGPYVLMRLGS